jgi:hypothetical protein
LGLLLGSTLVSIIAAATTPDLSNSPAAGYYLISPSLVGAAGGGFFGMLVGAVIGGILGARMATKSADGRKATEEEGKGVFQDNRAEQSAAADRPRDTRFRAP